MAFVTRRYHQVLGIKSDHTGTLLFIHRQLIHQICLSTRFTKQEFVRIIKLLVFQLLLAKTLSVPIHLFTSLSATLCPHPFMFPGAVESSPLQFLALA